MTFSVVSFVVVTVAAGRVSVVRGIEVAVAVIVDAGVVTVKVVKAVV